ncbi:MAG: thiamine pyrophosphate-binding protein, partial [Salinibacterium amurskyense]
MTIRPTNSPATNFSVALLEEFVRLGVRDIVLSPGSRSQAIALAAAEFEKHGLLRLRVRIDERVGAFLALGLAVETQSPVLVVTTSGTAVANLHPAVLEAHHSAVPLIIISADRPDSLRGIGSNQTTQQPGIFGTAVHQTWDVEAPTGAAGEMDAAAQLARDAVAAVNGPVHLNLSFDEPLSAPFVWHPTE